MLIFQGQKHILQIGVHLYLMPHSKSIAFTSYRTLYVCSEYETVVRLRVRDITVKCQPAFYWAELLTNKSRDGRKAISRLGLPGWQLESKPKRSLSIAPRLKLAKEPVLAPNGYVPKPVFGVRAHSVV